MIDFRYHIVSLVAVFLALAVGIVLGAGPLRGSLGETLTSQLEELRQEKETLRGQLLDAQATNDQLGLFVGEAGDRLLAGSLAGVNVAVVVFPGADPDITEVVQDRIAQAGGTVVAQASITAAWVDPGEADAREAAATEVADRMVVPPAADDPAAEVLGTALALGLTENDALSPDSLSSVATELYASLVSSAMVTAVGAPTAPADAVLVLAPVASGTPADAAQDVIDTEVETMVGMGGRAVVLAGSDTGAADLVNRTRVNERAAGAVSTVDSVNTVPGQVLVPLALAAAAAGMAAGQYGLADGAASVLPPAVEQPIAEPTEEVSQQPSESPSEHPSEEHTEAATQETS